MDRFYWTSYYWNYSVPQVSDLSWITDLDGVSCKFTTQRPILRLFPAVDAFVHSCHADFSRASEQKPISKSIIGFIRNHKTRAQNYYTPPPHIFCFSFLCPISSKSLVTVDLHTHLSSSIGCSSVHGPDDHFQPSCQGTLWLHWKSAVGAFAWAFLLWFLSCMQSDVVPLQKLGGGGGGVGVVEKTDKACLVTEGLFSLFLLRC